MNSRETRYRGWRTWSEKVSGARFVPDLGQGTTRFRPDDEYKIPPREKERERERKRKGIKETTINLPSNRNRLHYTRLLSRIPHNASGVAYLTRHIPARWEDKARANAVRKGGALGTRVEEGTGRYKRATTRGVAFISRLIEIASSNALEKPRQKDFPATKLKKRDSYRIKGGVAEAQIDADCGVAVLINGGQRRAKRTVGR